ncbi:MAG: Ppx/GppA phosphatase family protein [Alphaproteobacteria bacterium]
MGALGGSGGPSGTDPARPGRSRGGDAPARSGADRAPTPRSEANQPPVSRPPVSRPSAAWLGSLFQQTMANRGHRPRGAQNGSAQVYAALDLGTNNCRLLVARPRRSGFSVIDAYSRTVCLGENLSGTGVLDPQAMDRAIEALQVCVAKMERRGVTVARSIATQACRCARNGQEFLDRIHRETGLVLEIIPPAEEAWLAAMGCWPLVDRTCSTALVFDIGGGSTELIWLNLRGAGRDRPFPTVASWTSLPYGVVNLTERFGTPHLEPEVYPVMVAEMRASLSTFTGADPLRGDFGTGNAHIIGTSGTVTTLAGLMLGLPRYDREQVDGVWLEMERARGLIRKLAALDHPDRSLLPCIGTDRADFVLAGCAILEAIDSLWPTPRLRVADRGLREGILLSLMARPARKNRRRRMAGPRHARP